jgi:hypothetical protein
MVAVVGGFAALDRIQGVGAVDRLDWLSVVGWLDRLGGIDPFDRFVRLVRRGPVLPVAVVDHVRALAVVGHGDWCERLVSPSS